MSGTASWRADPSRDGRIVLGAFIVVAVAGSAAMFVFPHEATIPFHLVWVSFAVAYGLRSWPGWQTAVALVLITSVTGLALFKSAMGSPDEWDELSEIPLMALLFAVMAWHVRRRAEAVDRLGRLAEQQRRFVRKGSHQLRTPLTVARGYAELARDARHGETTHADIKVVIEELDKLETIAGRLLGLGANALTPEPFTLVPTSAREICERVVRRWRPVAERHWRCEADDVTVLVAAARIETALDCLVENAVHFTDVGGSVAVEAHRDRDRVTFVVDDSGHLGRPATGRPRPGTGLGLQIARGVARDHDGDVSLERRPDGGTTARLWVSTTLAADSEPAQAPTKRLQSVAPTGIPRQRTPRDFNPDASSQ
jgi:signal transduction histidine kinase